MMTLAYLLTAGIMISLIHAYIVWKHRDNRRYSLSEHAIIDRQTQVLYLLGHIALDILIILFSYRFFVIEQNYRLPFYLNIIFAIFDFAQAVLPSRGKTEKLHFVSAYISWLCYLSAGLLAYTHLEIDQPYRLLAGLVFVPILLMFGYMHINRAKLWPYQVIIVPLFVVAMSIMVIGAKP